MAASKSLLRTGHYRHSLFFAHLAIEKALKAQVTKQTRQVPPKVHNLVRLAEIAKLQLPVPQATFLKQFNLYQLEGRYPDSVEPLLTKKTSAAEQRQAEEFLKWLTAQS